MHDKRFRLIAVFILFAVCLSIGYWLYLWSADVFLYWGVPSATARWLAVLVSCVSLSTILIRPIPIKVHTIAMINLVAFSLLYTVLFLLLKQIWPMVTHYGWFWQGGIAAIASCAAMLVYGYLHGKKLRLTRYIIKTDLPVQGGALRIGLISDVHMGLTYNAERLEQQLHRLQLEQPDLLIIAGDLVDDRTTPEQMREACSIVGNITTTYGTFFMYGNHDLANHGPKPPYAKQELDAALSGQNIHILDDQVFEVAGLTLVGRHDAGFARHADRASLTDLLQSVDKYKPIILIDHQPREMKEAAQTGVTLQVGGHTHAGQVWPMSWFAQLFSFAYGHRCIGGMHAIISSGMGNRGSVLRSGCTAEMVLIRLENAI